MRTAAGATRMLIPVYRRIEALIGERAASRAAVILTSYYLRMPVQ